VIVILNGIPQIDSPAFPRWCGISIKLAREGGVLRLVCGQGRVATPSPSPPRRSHPHLRIRMPQTPSKTSLRQQISFPAGKFIF